MPPDDILLNKAAIIERCMRRMHQEYEANPALDNLTHVDALTLNIERACQAAIDMAMHVLASRHLGIPQGSADAFRLLLKADVISEHVTRRMQAMTGFRNVVVHEYQQLDLDILRSIAESSQQDFMQFCRELGLTIAP